MTIKNKSIKILWADAAGRCSYPGCGEKLTVGQAGEQAPHTLGEMAHIKGNREGSNRYDINQTAEQRDHYENLILLCPTHHNLIDKAENESIYTVDKLIEMKLDHENTITKRLAVEESPTIEKLKNMIAIYLAENKQSWEQYGPLSERARKNPYSEEIYAVWTSERLSTIVPNNRLITRLLEDHRNLFNIQHQAAISRFLSHARSYERWVQDEVSYKAVMRFPTDFEDLIFGD